MITHPNSCDENLVFSGCPVEFLPAPPILQKELDDYIDKTFHRIAQSHILLVGIQTNRPPIEAQDHRTQSQQETK